MQRYDWKSLTAEQQAALLRRPALADSSRIAARVQEILEAVRSGGDDAVRALTREIDGVEIAELVPNVFLE